MFLSSIFCHKFYRSDDFALVKSDGMFRLMLLFCQSVYILTGFTHAGIAQPVPPHYWRGVSRLRF